MRSSIISSAILLLMFFVVGCDKSTVPKDEPTEAEWTLVTLHIDKFKKSKSGAT